jgi:hypothetical protein
MCDVPEDQEEFDEAWARIVEDLTGTDPELGMDPGTEQASGTAGTAPPEAEATAGASGPDPGLAALFEPLRRREPPPDAFVDNWEDEGHFTPPEPPEIPVGTPAKRLAWAGALGGPTVLVLTALTGWDAPGVVTLGAGLAALAGFATLVWHLPDSRGDGWDDGARL